MLTAETVRPSDLGPRDLAAWAALRDSAEAFQSPLLGPDFARAVGRVRSDAAVAVIRRDGRAIGFLPHHRRPGGLARPIGAPLSDYHALIAEPGLSGLEAMRLGGLREYRFSGLIDPHGAFPRASGSTALVDAHAIAIGPGADAGAEHLETLRSASAKRFKNLRRIDHKLEREMGPVALVGPDRDPAVFAALMSWKRAQFRRTGLTDVFAAEWIHRLVRRLFDDGEGRLSGLMITLQVSGRPAAAHFGVREGDRYHPWIASHDPALDAYSPGQVFLWRAIEAMPALGLRWYDLAAGHDHYKIPYASRTLQLAEGRLRTVPGLDAEAWRLAETVFGVGGVSRARRRLDQIAAVELTFEGRLRSMVEAVATHGRREASRPLRS